MSNRYRANKSITNKITSSAAIIARLRKQTVDPHLGTRAIGGVNLSNGSVTDPNIGGDAVTDRVLGRGVVGTENLGVVNRVASDSNFTLALPGKLLLDGALYPAPSAGNLRPMVMESGGFVVPGQSTYTATVDPLWTVGFPNITLSTGTVVATSGWASGFTPAPGQTVKAVHDGAAGWFILPPSTGPDGRVNAIDAVSRFNSTFKAYDPTTWREPAFTRTADGIVMLTGMGAPTVSSLAVDTLIYTLPVGFRPDATMMFIINGGTDTVPFRIRVEANGNVSWVYGGTPITNGQYFSFGGVTFPAAGVATWTNVAATGTATVAAFAANWTSNNLAGYPPVSYWKDPYGLVWWRGQAKTSVVVSVDNTPIVLYNSQALAPAKEMHFPTFLDGGSTGGAGSSAISLWYKATNTIGAGGYISLDGVVVSSIASDTLLSWTAMTLLNSWGNYSPTQFPSGTYANRNGMVYSRGLLSAGSMALPMWQFPSGWRQTGGIGQDRVGPYGTIYCRLSVLVFARLDIGGNGNVVPVKGTNTWYSVDGLMTPMEQ